MRTAIATAAAALTVAAAAHADGGGPSPGVVTGWDGILAPGKALRYVALPTQDETTMVAAVRTRDGRVVRWSWSPVRGTMGIPLVTYGGDTDGITANGRLLVLAGQPELKPGKPGGTTRFAVLRLPSLQLANLIVLDGIWSYDAVSPDGKTIYALQHRSASPVAPPRYRVRAIDVEHGVARPGAIVDRREPNEPMVGFPQTRTYGPGQRVAYTLYTRQNGTAFIHALDTTHSTAHCIDLPRRLAKDPGNLRLHADSKTLQLLRNGRPIAQVDLTTLTLHD